MAQDWGLEALKGIGKIFMHPSLYFAVIVAILVGFWRVKRERADFHISVYPPLQELRYLFSSGWIIGIILSVISIAAGFTVSFDILATVFLAFAILTIIGGFRLISSAFTIGLAYLVIYISKHFQIHLSYFGKFESTSWTSLSGLVILLGLLLIAEGILMIRGGYKESSPKYRKSRRGLTVGAFRTKRIWMIPMFCFLPAGPLTAPFSWWPTLDFGTHSYSLILVPFIIGFQQQVQSTLPQIAVKKLGKQVLWIGIVTVCMAAGGLWISILSLIGTAFAIISRGFISYRHRVREGANPYYFTPRDNGLIILTVIPGSPADKLSLKTGEVIHKCNGHLVRNTDEFYRALQKNRAYCKLEVFDTNEQIRFVQGALYEGDHHELGIITVEEKKKWGTGEAS
ncbi:PDZ domain-containing protein [Bacillus sp. FJAT-49736]|nr:PDZ domain-containing protein [Bacillus sp. FJAT-49736]